MRGGENATRRVPETQVGVVGQCPGSFRASSVLWGAFREEFGEPVEREVERSAGAVPCVLWRNPSELGKAGPGVRGSGTRCLYHVPSTAEFKPRPPRPGGLEVFPTRTADSAEPPVWLGALWTSSGRWEQRHQPVRPGRTGGLCERLGLTLRAVRLLLRGLDLLQNFPNRGSGRDTRDPTAESPTPFSGAAPCAPGAVAAVESQPGAAPPPPGAVSPRGTAPHAGAWAAASRTLIY